MHRSIHRLLLEYKDARRGPTVILFQSHQRSEVMVKGVPSLEEFPIVHVPAQERYVWRGGVVSLNHTHSA